MCAIFHISYQISQELDWTSHLWVGFRIQARHYQLNRQPLSHLSHTEDALHGCGCWKRTKRCSKVLLNYNRNMRCRCGVDSDTAISLYLLYALRDTQEPVTNQLPLIANNVINVKRFYLCRFLSLVRTARC